MLRRHQSSLGSVSALKLSRALSDSAPIRSRTHADLLPLCSAVDSLRQARQLHASAVGTGLLPRSVSFCAALILSYAATGALSASRRLFEATVGFCNTAFLWNTLVRACYVSRDRHGFRVYNRMVRTGFVSPDGHTFPFVLKMCTDFGEVQKGLETHACVFKVGFDGDVFVGNTLMAFYGSAGDMVAARKVFDDMSERDAVSWNTVIGLFSVSGLCDEAVGYYRGMSSSLLRPNSVSVISALPACVGLGRGGNQIVASQIHCYAVKVGLDLHVMIGNALVDVYGKCGNIKASKRVFHEMSFKNDVSWNSAITSLAYVGQDRDALLVFRSMIELGLTPNSITISSMLPILVQLGLLREAKEAHGFSVRAGIDSDIFISNSLIDMYSKSGRSKSATSIFESMVEKNVVSWNAMVSNLAQNGLERAAIELVRQMQIHGEIPNGVTFTNVLPGCSRLGFHRQGKEIHAMAIRSGASSDYFVSNALTDMYAKCRSLSSARTVFNVSERDQVSYNTLIVGYSNTTDCSESLTLFSEMSAAGLRHDNVSYVGVISACANLGALKHGREAHGSWLRRYLRPHLFVWNALVDLYAKCGRTDLARRVFDGIPERDATSWNAMITGYGMAGEVGRAVELFEAMARPDSVSYVAVLSACSHGGLVEEGKKYLSQMKGGGIEPTQTHYACVVDLLGRGGLMEEALELIKALPLPSADVWAALLGACRVHGNVELGAWAAENLFRLRPAHSGYYVLLSNMYAEAGKWDDANRVRQLMRSRGVKKGPSCSWVKIGDCIRAFGAGDTPQGLA